MTPTTPKVLALYRDRHVIKPTRDFDEDLGRMVQVCDHDGIRIYTTRAGYRHDASAIKDLAAIERGEGLAW